MELMIESFKFLNDGSKLNIAIPDQRDPIPLIDKFYKNLSNHQGIIYHQDICQFKNIKNINSIYAVWIFVTNEMLQDTFCLVTSDCVFQKALDISFSDEPEINLNLDPYFSFEFVANVLGDFWTWFSQDDSIKIKNSWIPLGQAICFNKIPTSFFEKVVQIAEVLTKKQQEKDLPIWEMTPRLAWVLGMIFYSNEFKVNQDIDVQYVTSNDQGHFVTYEHGLNDLFNKKQFLFTSPHFITAGDPVETLATLMQTKNLHYLSDLAKSSINSR